MSQYIYIHTYMHACIHTCTVSKIHGHVRVFTRARVLLPFAVLKPHAYERVLTYVYMHAYHVIKGHSHLYTYIHTYIHIYIHSIKGPQPHPIFTRASLLMLFAILATCLCMCSCIHVHACMHTMQSKVHSFFSVFPRASLLMLFAVFHQIFVLKQVFVPFLVLLNFVFERHFFKFLFVLRQFSARFADDVLGLLLGLRL